MLSTCENGMLRTPKRFISIIKIGAIVTKRPSTRFSEKSVRSAALMTSAPSKLIISSGEATHTNDVRKARKLSLRKFSPIPTNIKSFAPITIGLNATNKMKELAWALKPSEK